MKILLQQKLNQSTHKYAIMKPDMLQEDFKPKGAVAFFILLIILSLTIWFGIYYIMLQRN
jgi:hypothetical protein